jgi:Protein of unknown function (DUF4242)
MLYAAKCYWPGVDERDLERVAARALRRSESGVRDGVAYVGSLLFAADDLVLCMFDGPSRAAVKRVSESVGIPCERVIDSVWLGARRDDLKGAMR